MTLIIGHIALVQRSKRQDFVLDIVEQLRQDGVDAIALFAGKIRDRNFLNELQESTDKKGLKEYVYFLGRREDIPDLLKIIDVLIIPSSFEGFPLAGLEAAAAGVPVVACNESGAEEFVKMSGAGILFAYDDVKDAANAVLEGIRYREGLKEAGYKFVEQCTIQQYKKAIVNIFQKYA